MFLLYMSFFFLLLFLTESYTERKSQPAKKLQGKSIGGGPFVQELIVVHGPTDSC